MTIARRLGAAVVLAAFLTLVGLGTTVAAARGGCHGCRPLISSVSLSGTNGDYTAVVKGHGFGGAPVAMPFTGDLSTFRIGDEAQGPQAEWGYTGDADVLQYEVWSPSEVEVTGLGAAAGDALVVALWNTTTGRGATWGGTAPPPAPGAPVVRSVAFSSLGTPVDLRIVVKGAGFGPAPVPLPFVGDLDWLSFWDGRGGCGSSAAFSAGGHYFGAGPADAVTLRYLSWSDTKIVIGGLRGAYGSGCATVRAGDPVAVTVWNTGDTSLTGPQSAGRGLILYGFPGN